MKSNLETYRSETNEYFNNLLQLLDEIGFTLRKFEYAGSGRKKRFYYCLIDNKGDVFIEKELKPSTHHKGMIAAKKQIIKKLHKEGLINHPHLEIDYITYN